MGTFVSEEPEAVCEFLWRFEQLGEPQAVCSEPIVFPNLPFFCLDRPDPKDLCPGGDGGRGGGGS